MVAEVTDETFESEVLWAGLPTLVDFWAEWCAPCKMVTSVVEEIAAEYAGRLQVVKMDTAANPATAARLGIMSIPALVLFKDGEEVQRVVGYRPKQAVVEAILPHLDPD